MIEMQENGYGDAEAGKRIIDQDREFIGFRAGDIVRDIHKAGRDFPNNVAVIVGFAESDCYPKQCYPKLKPDDVVESIWTINLGTLLRGYCAGVRDYEFVNGRPIYDNPDPLKLIRRQSDPDLTKEGLLNSLLEFLKEEHKKDYRTIESCIESCKE